MMHVMDALVSHGCLIVDVTDGGTTYSDALTINKMWATSSDFFETVSGDKNIERLLPYLKMAEGADSPHVLAGSLPTETTSYILWRLELYAMTMKDILLQVKQGGHIQINVNEVN